MLTTARDALLASAAGLAPTRALFVGDSFPEGEGASALVNTFRFRTVARLRTLRAIAGAALGLIPARPYATYRPASAAWRSPSSGTATTAPNWNISQGLKGVRFTAVGQYREWIVTGTAVDVMYLQAAGAGGGNITVAVNGTTVATINANDSGQTYQPSKSHRVTFAGGRGTYTVRVTSGATQGIVDGLVVYDGDDVGGGIIAYDCTRTGAQSNVIAVDDIVNGWTAIQPHLVVDDQVGSNDFLDSARNPAAVVANLNTRLNAYAALASSPTVVILVPWRLPSTAGTNSLGFTYEQYITAVKAACASHAYAASIRVLDLQDVYPDAATQPWHDGDGLHPNDLGHDKIAEALASFIVGLGMQQVSGTAVAASSAAGKVTLRANVSGTAIATSSAAGTVRAVRLARGIAAAVSGAMGAVTARLGVSGTAAAQSGASGRVTSLQQVSGTADAVSGASGNPSRVGGLSGTAAAQSGASGRVTSLQRIAGIAVAVSGAIGAVVRAGGLSGTAAAQSGASGRVTSLQRVSGVAVGSSGASGGAERVGTVHVVSGVAVGVSGSSGRMVDAAHEPLRIVSIVDRRRAVDVRARTRVVTIKERAS